MTVILLILTYNANVAFYKIVAVANKLGGG